LRAKWRSRVGLLATSVRGSWILLLGCGQGVGYADQSVPVELEQFSSENGAYVVIVDPQWNESRDAVHPEIELKTGAGRLVWRKKATDFEDFRYPLHVSVSDDGQFLVFGGASVHNMIDDENYREGVRIYRADGTLVRFVSRRDLRPGSYGVSTASWYDSERSGIRSGEFHLFTPDEDDPLVLRVSSGRLVRGDLIPGQGDDSHWDFAERLIAAAKKGRK
jgi:hypothetical protein